MIKKRITHIGLRQETKINFRERSQEPINPPHKASDHGFEVILRAWEPGEGVISKRKSSGTQERTPQRGLLAGNHCFGQERSVSA